YGVLPEADHCQPPVNHPIFNAHNDLLSFRPTLMEQMEQLTSMCEMFCQFIQKKQKEKRIEEEQTAKAQNSKIPVCYDDEDDYNSAITPNEPEDIHLAKRLLYDNSSPRPPKEIVSDNSNDDIESFSPSPIPVKDSDSHMEEIDLPFTPDDPMPPGIEYDDYDSGRDIPILKNCLTIIPFYSPPMSHTILIFLYLIVLLQNHQMEKSPDLVPHQGLEAFQPSVKLNDLKQALHGRHHMFILFPEI
nr:hypothetical protein [Tanacetum cinerariifolium]